MQNEKQEKTTDVQKTGYDLLIERMKDMEKKIEEQNEKIEDVVNMNKALLDGNTEHTAPADKDADKKALEEKLYKGLKL